MDRAYSILTVKAVGEERRVIRGIASTPEPDRVGDVVEPLGAVFRNPLPLLHQHDAHAPVGTVSLSRPTSDGIEFEAHLPKIDEPGPLKDRVDTAWGEIKSGLVRAVSIGFKPLSDGIERIKGGGLRFTKTEILELSLVTVAANMAATITEIRSLDRQARARTGHQRAPEKTHPPGSGSTPTTGSPAMTTISERIATLEGLRGHKAARIDEVMQRALAANRTTEEGERTECLALKGEIEVIDGDLDLLRFQEHQVSRTAQAISALPGIDLVPRRLTVPAMARPPEPEPGIRLVRKMRCEFMAHVEKADIARIAEREYGTRDPKLVELIKAPVPAMTTTVGGDGLVPVESGFGDYADFLRAAEIMGKFGTNGIPPLRRVPFRSGLVTMVAGATGYWVGEAKPKPLTQIDTARTHLLPLKTATIVAISMELMRDSSPAAEPAIRSEMTAAILALIDVTFVNPANAGVAGVSPPSITHGQPAVASSGADADDIRTDLRSLFALYDAAHNPASQAVLVMSTSNARSLGMMVNPLGQAEFPSMSVNGGSLLGTPVIASDYVGNVVILVSAGDVYLADEGGVSIDMSTEASLEMADAPTQSQPTGAALVSLWQNNLVGFRAERTINWGPRRPVCAPYLTGVAWGGAVTAPTP